jgi:hypothetical protein
VTEQADHPTESATEADPGLGTGAPQQDEPAAPAGVGEPAAEAEVDEPAAEAGVDESAAEAGVDETAGADDGSAPDPRVAAAVRRLDELSDLAPAEHVDVYESVHRSLQESLAEAAEEHEDRPGSTSP